MRARLLVLAVAGLVLAGCADSLAIPEGGLSGIEAPPAVGNTTDSFGFSVAAQDLEFDQTYALSFTSEAVTVGLSVIGYADGAAHLDLLDADGAAIYSRDLSQSIAEGSERVPGRPAQAVLRFEGFSGVVSLGVSAQP